MRSLLEYKELFFAVKGRIKSVLGDFWWYTFLVFVVQRFGDAINAFVGLWLVPKYVRQDELGALLPLMQVGSVLACPLQMLVTVFLKYVNVFSTRGELGKLKALLRDTFCMLTLLFVGVMLYAQFFMPLVFERMRVANGRLGMLVVATGILSVVATFFSGSLQALKQFQSMSFIMLVAAPLRLVTLLICLPIRALSGYFVGQIVPVLYSIGTSLFCLRTVVFRKGVQSVSYLHTDGADILRYAIPVGIATFSTVTLGLVDPFVIRHRLPDLDSAAYYAISRFAELGTYVALSACAILFPLASELHEKGGRSQRLVIQSVVGTLASGGLLAGFLFLFGDHLLRLVPNGDAYTTYTGQMALLTVICSMYGAANCFSAHEFACNRYAFNYWAVPLLAVKGLFLYVIMGFSFFRPWVPESWIQWVDSIRPARLDFVLGVMFVYAVSWLFFMSIHLLVQRKGRMSSSDLRRRESAGRGSVT